jgi:MHS family proline/betaine transporter-like MFS transporter
LLASPDSFRLTVTQLVLCAVLGVLLGPYATTIAEQFSVKVRSTGMAISYNITVMIFGGFAQLIVTWLLHVTGSLLTPGLYLLFGAALGILGSFLLSKNAAPGPAHTSTSPAHSN